MGTTTLHTPGTAYKTHGRQGVESMPSFTAHASIYMRAPILVLRYYLSVGKMNIRFHDNCF